MDDEFARTLRTRLLHVVTLLDAVTGLRESGIPGDAEAADELAAGALTRALRLIHLETAFAAGAASFLDEMHAEVEEAA